MTTPSTDPVEIIYLPEAMRAWADCQVEHKHDGHSCVPDNIVLSDN